jgi:small basic protein (TIGR04137 family)
MRDTGEAWQLQVIQREKVSCGNRSVSMSQHSSLKAASRIVTKRNVLKRFERIELLKSRGKRKDEDRGFGLPKTKPS